MGRKLFCEISPTTYKISMEKNILQRHLKDFFSKEHFARKKSNEPLPVIIKKHNSLIRRRLGNVDMQLQENKAAKAAMKAANLVDMEISMPIAMTFQPSKLPVFFVSCKYPPAVRPCRPFARRPAVFELS